MIYGSFRYLSGIFCEIIHSLQTTAGERVELLLAWAILTFHIVLLKLPSFLLLRFGS